ncbi:RAD protein [Plasmodium gonderi]|uniref:RAD protein n=1 Tax=Plasmodium gonderi TaxID=77519 RepID=A0A1Y1JI58_PLAGO|nr:RAD protein [Plasmodium gonderi]GAW79784.1 RAD protein [Plasmodium gonderi]
MENQHLNRSRKTEQNYQKGQIYLLQNFLTLLIILLDVLLQHKIDFLKCGKLVEPELNISHPRKLAQMATKMKKKISQIVSDTPTNENDKKIYSGRNFNLPFGCSNEELSGELTEEEINKMISSCIFFVSNKKAYILFYHYNNYLKKTFTNMIKDLSKQFKDLALKHGMSEEERKKIWENCEKDLTYELINMDDTAVKAFYFFVKKRVFYLSLREFLIRCKEFWYLTIRKNQEKWLQILTQAARNCKRKATEDVQKQGQTQMKTQKLGQTQGSTKRQLQSKTSSVKK